ncbi:hypothetical protein Pla110_09320 [Polystyrenella longa]|uniref:TPM domain-containing protein n=1 Tax=Polystyrenella longa TaxID=2528007 RepID=A0A518CJ19_9PLAN|nr:hypothetical protein [Polystyrenella longa]QDU79226.1 hypothetical protein Pla110_09320 [Polystyrenella longa]
MGTASRNFSDDDRERINQAVKQAETITSAEIVPVVAGSSGRYDRAEDIVGVWVAGLLIVLTWLFYPLPVSDAGDWSATHPLWQLIAILIAGVVGFLLGAVLGTCYLPLRRMFTPVSQMQEEVYTRARQVFYDNRVHHTAGASGVLLYVSLYEHQAAVIADQTVLDKIDQAGLHAICTEFTDRLHTESMASALCETIQHLGERLATDLPATGEKKNELSDALVELE